MEDCQYTGEHGDLTGGSIQVLVFCCFTESMGEIAH